MRWETVPWTLQCLSLCGQMSCLCIPQHMFWESMQKNKQTITNQEAITWSDVIWLLGNSFLLVLHPANGVMRWPCNVLRGSKIELNSHSLGKSHLRLTRKPRWICLLSCDWWCKNKWGNIYIICMWEKPVVKQRILQIPTARDVFPSRAETHWCFGIDLARGGRACACGALIYWRSSSAQHELDVSGLNISLQQHRFCLAPSLWTKFTLSCQGRAQVLFPTEWQDVATAGQRQEGGLWHGYWNSCGKTHSLQSNVSFVLSHQGCEPVVDTLTWVWPDSKLEEGSFSIFFLSFLLLAHKNGQKMNNIALAVLIKFWSYLGKLNGCRFSP